MNDIYTPPESDVTTDQDETVYAGFWIRLFASLIDSIWLVILTAALGWLIYGVTYFESEDFMLGIGDFLVSYVMPFAITIAFWIYKSATPGKMLLGVRIVDAESLGAVSKGRLAIRYLGYYVSTLVLLLGFLWVIWDPRKQGWHDKMARTVVIKNR